MSVYTTVENFGPNPSNGHYDTWYGTEVKDADGYNELTTVVIGGSYEITGPGAGDVDVITSLLGSETGVHGGPLEPNWPYGDYGYHVHLRQGPNGAEFTITVNCQYVL